MSTSDLMCRQWHTPSPMDKQNELIRKSCEASNPGFWSHCKEHQDVGLKSCHLYYGVSILRQTGPQDTRHFSWSMEQRQFSLVISGTIRLVWQLMLKQTMRQHGKTLWTYWTRSVIYGDLPARSSSLSQSPG